MTDQSTLDLSSPDDDAVTLADYAQTAYLEYALSVVKGRALPDACDGQKPVQRRILYAMERMGLGFSGAGGAKPVKSARVVGDVLGRFHPHGDQAAYDALVRMAQDFSQRYPLIDGHGNFGSRDGDGAAAMRYTEARLARIASLLLDEIDQGTVDFMPNYDGSTQEPRQLPARLPFSLLNGASGIAVGLATEIPSHNLREVADACIALVKNAKLTDDELFALLPGPDYPGGGQLISPAADIRDAYRSGRGSLKVRARWKIEELARGQWQMVVTELPPGTSTQKVLEEIEEITNPKVRAGKKALSAEQTQLKDAMLAVLDVVRDESSKDAPVRIVFEPKTSRIDQQELITALLAHTSLETSAPVNLTLVGLDGRPVQKSLREMLTEWIAFRQTTITRRSQHRLAKVLDHIHILEGRQLVLLNIDEVIAIIRASDEPKAALIARFRLSDRQAEDILEIRLLQQEKKAVAEVRVVDEPVTVVVSEKGWVRARQGQGHDAASFAFKAGDALYGTFECRTVDQLIVFGSNGRVYSVPVAQLPGARGDGQPVTTLIDLEPGTQAAHYFAGPAQATLLLSSSAGYGFLASVENLVSRQRGGKAFVSVANGESICRPSPVAGVTIAAGARELPAATHVACASTGGRILTFEIGELKSMASGGRGLLLMDLDAKDSLAGAAAYTRSVRIAGVGRGGKPRAETLEIRSLNNARAARGRKGRVADLGFKPTSIERVE